MCQPHRMKRVGPLLSLMQQAVFALAIGVIASLCWFVEVLFRTHVHASIALCFILYSVFQLVSFIASIWISYDLRTGIESGRWPEAEIGASTASLTFGR